MASLMISEIFLDADFVNFSRDLFSSSFTRSEMTLRNCSFPALLFFDGFGSFET
jgi:hypothetical protein